MSNSLGENPTRVRTGENVLSAIVPDETEEEEEAEVEEAEEEETAGEEEGGKRSLGKI